MFVVVVKTQDVQCECWPSQFAVIISDGSPLHISGSGLVFNVCLDPVGRQGWWWPGRLGHHTTDNDNKTITTV